MQVMRFFKRNALFLWKVSARYIQIEPFEVSIGRNANFRIFGEKGSKYKYLQSKPYKECRPLVTTRMCHLSH